MRKGSLISYTAIFIMTILLLPVLNNIYISYSSIPTNKFNMESFPKNNKKLASEFFKENIQNSFTLNEIKQISRIQLLQDMNLTGMNVNIAIIGPSLSNNYGYNNLTVINLGYFVPSNNSIDPDYLISILRSISPESNIIYLEVSNSFDSISSDLLLQSFQIIKNYNVSITLILNDFYDLSNIGKLNDYIKTNFLNNNFIITTTGDFGPTFGRMKNLDMIPFIFKVGGIEMINQDNDLFNLNNFYVPEFSGRANSFSYCSPCGCSRLQ